MFINKRKACVVYYIAGVPNVEAQAGDEKKGEIEKKWV